MSAKLPRISKFAGETTLFCADFQDRTVIVNGGELEGTPTVTSSPSGLTISNAGIIDETFSDPDGDVPSGKGVSFTVSGGTAGTSYTITVTADVTPGDTVLVCKGIIAVE